MTVSTSVSCPGARNASWWPSESSSSRSNSQPSPSTSCSSHPRHCSPSLGTTRLHMTTARRRSRRLRASSVADRRLHVLMRGVLPGGARASCRRTHASDARSARLSSLAPGAVSGRPSGFDGNCMFGDPSPECARHPCLRLDERSAFLCLFQPFMRWRRCSCQNRENRVESMDRLLGSCERTIFDQLIHKYFPAWREELAAAPGRCLAGRGTGARYAIDCELGLSTTGFPLALRQAIPDEKVESRKDETDTFRATRQVKIPAKVGREPRSSLAQSRATEAVKHPRQSA